MFNKTNTDNSTWNLFAHPVCMCGSHNVSINAVNRCNRVGVSTQNMTVDPKPLPDLSRDCNDVTLPDLESTTTDPMHSDECTCKLFLYSFSQN